MSGLTLSAGIVVYAIVMMMNDDCWLSLMMMKLLPICLTVTWIGMLIALEVIASSAVAVYLRVSYLQRTWGLCFFCFLLGGAGAR